MSDKTLNADLLKQRQALPLDLKIRLTQSRIREWYSRWQGDVYVSYSGGKDSTVLLDLVRNCPGVYDVPAVFCDTGLEYPEVRELALKNADVVLKPKMNFKQVIEKYGYPFPSKEQALYIRQYRHTKSEKLRDLRWNGYPPNGNFAISKKWRFLCEAPFEVSEKCCDVMKKSPFHKYEKESGFKPFIATMAVESRLRTQEYLQHGCNAFDIKRAKSTPMGFWTEQDVLEYLAERESLNTRLATGKSSEMLTACSKRRGSTERAACSACSGCNTTASQTASSKCSTRTPGSGTTASTSWA